MESFYGGKQGRTYHIVKSYDTVQDMVTAFNSGGSYIEANYGQYVLIDTLSNENVQNGLLFRRGFDYKEEYIEPPIQDTYEYADLDENDEPIGDSYYHKEEFLNAFRNWLKNGVGGGAIYVGQIAGPEGPVPEVDLIGWDAGSVGNNNNNSNDYFEWYQLNQQTNTDVQDPVSTTPGLIAIYDENNPTEITGYQLGSDAIKVGRVNIKDSDGNLTGAK